MNKMFVYLFLCCLAVVFSPGLSMALNPEIKNIHSKEGSKQDCNICHIFNNMLKKDISTICVDCHKDSVSIMRDNTLATHILPMSKHVIKKSLPFDKFFDKIKEEGGRVYVEDLNGRLPLSGANPQTATMECTTCHEPHGDSGSPNFLRVDNSRGQLCQVCHGFDQLTLKPSDISVPARQVSFEEVHTWPGSQCNLCHLSANPDFDVPSLIDVDQSRLCESCHKGTVTILAGDVLRSRIEKMSNHPIKFSPLDFDQAKINHNIIKEGKSFFVSGPQGNVPLFGETKEFAVAECVTCHEPHGKSKTPKLPRIDNSKGQLCLVCHVGIKP